MTNTIEEELALAKDNMFKVIPFQNQYLVELTRENVALVEAMIRNDSAYIKSTDVYAKPIYKKNGTLQYAGSSVFWMSELKKFLIDNIPTDYDYSSIIKGAVESVDRENSTHLNSDGVGRHEIIERIINFDKSEFVECLKNPEYKSLKLLNCISARTSANKRARINVSFASKFCHYACFYLYKGTEYQDNYSIYDSILKTVLPLYLSYFNIEDKFNLMNYQEYRTAIDMIRASLCVDISRNGFDHLLWYYHKGRL